MKHKKNIFLLSLGFFGSVLAPSFLHAPQQEQKSFRTTQLEKRSITQIIEETGALWPEDILRIGSLVEGIIQKMYVEVNDEVKKGMLLARIDDGKEDTLVRESKARLEQSKNDLEYQINFYQRQRALYAKQFISQDFFEQVTRNFKDAKEEVLKDQAIYDREVLQFNNKRIIAPEKGIIIAKISSEGETVTLTSPPTIIYEIARDLTRMEARIQVNEDYIGSIKEGMRVILHFDTYPYETFQGTIRAINSAPTQAKQKEEKNKHIVQYAAIVPVDNTRNLFRPGMTVMAKLNLGKSKNVLTAPSAIFTVKKKYLAQIAAKNQYEMHELFADERKEISGNKQLRAAWIFKDNAFIEKRVKIGATENGVYEIISGLAPTDNIVSYVSVMS